MSRLCGKDCVNIFIYTLYFFGYNNNLSVICEQYSACLSTIEFLELCFKYENCRHNKMKVFDIANSPRVGHLSAMVKQCCDQGDQDLKREVSYGRHFGHA